MRKVYSGRELEIGKIGPSHYMIEGFEVDKCQGVWRVFDGPLNVFEGETLVDAKNFIAERIESR